MNNNIFCVKKKQLLPALSHAPIHGELGNKILQSVSYEAWREWLKHQTLLINEHKLSLVDLSSQEFLIQEMEKYFFGDGSTKPAGYVEK